MAIEAPKWVERAGAYPTKDGWTVDRAKGRTEVIKRRKFTAAQIAEWYGDHTPAPAVQTLHEAPVVETVVAPEVVEFHYGEEDDVDHEEE